MSQRWLSLLLSLSLCTTGCMRTSILEQTALILMVGYDKMGDGQIRGTSLLYQVDPRAKEKTQVITSTATSSKGARDINILGLSKQLVSGQLRVAMYSEELARQKGMLELADTLSRDANVGRMLYVSVCKGKALDLMKFRYPETSNLGTFLYQDIRQNTIGGNLPSATLHEFIRDYYEIGRDPVVPVIEKIAKKITVTRIALFQDDRMMGDVPPRDGYFIKAFRDHKKSTHLEVRIKTADLPPIFREKPKKDFTTIVLSTLKQSGTVHVTDPEKLQFEVSLQVRAEMLEISEQVDLANPQTEPALAKVVSKQLTSELQDLLQQFQTMNADPIGIGERYRVAVRNSSLTRHQWHHMFPKTHLKALVHVTFVRSGVVE